MLFNSSTFLVQFLPVALIGYFLLGRLGRTPAVAWLSAMSLVFYGTWNPTHVPLLLGSTLANWWIGRILAERPRAWLLVTAVAANLLVLGYYKYTGFLLQSANDIAGAGLSVPQIILPLALSFFTFQQIAYLSDAHDGEASEPSLLNYVLFVTFFPHLVAGPITHHREMLPQFEDRATFRPQLGLLSAGATLFLIGLFKKVVLADPMGAYATPAFAAVANGEALSLIPAWAAALSYTLQIYFDFSGYTDMAIGLGLLFGISLPPNFNSPFKARSIIEFWQRWHMTLTRFLTAYVYNPIVMRMTRARARAGLPMPRRGKMTAGSFAMLVAGPTILTMFLSGIWHGAGWQYIVFGLLHGLFLTVNHGWRALKQARGIPADAGGRLADIGCLLLTFGCVVVGLVFFRAPDVTTAVSMLAGMAGLHGAPIDYTMQALRGVHTLAQLLGLESADLPHVTGVQLLHILALMGVVWFLPNPSQWMRLTRTALQERPPAPHWLERLRPAPPFLWRPSVAVGVAVGVIGFLALARALSVAPTEFLYFQF